MRNIFLSLLLVLGVIAQGSQSIVVQKGDSLIKVLSATNLSEFEVKQWVYNSELPKLIGSLIPGDKIQVERDNNITQLTYQGSRGKLIKFVRLGDGTVITDQPSDVKPSVRSFKSFFIKNSLTVDGKAAGLSYNTLQALADIYAWEIDFTKDLRKGDVIQLVVEQKELASGYLSSPEIVFAKIIQQHKTHEAIRYVDSQDHVGYYNVQGQSLTRSFLREPLKYTRISSPFSLHREHPVFGGARPHSGVDLAAKRGTPVWATSTGKVIFSGRKGGYGKAVIIKHGSRVTTLYAHLDRIAKGVKKGVMISGKQVIGYVGSTGVATGPHLHYEFRIDQRPVDPMAIDLPRSKPLAGMSYLKMLAERQQWLTLIASQTEHA